MRRRWVWIAVLAAGVLLVAYAGGARRNDGPPLDPSSTSRDGAKAVVELVDQLGGDVEVVRGAPDDSVGTALLLEDRLSREEADDLEAWVEAGGTLVVADRRSAFTPTIDGQTGDEVTGRCDIPALQDVEAVRLEEGGITYDLPPGARGCLGSTENGFFVVDEPAGAGHVISVGDASAFTNAYLDEADNAVLAAELLVDETAATAFVQRGVPGGGEDTLFDLVATPVRAALAQLLVVFLVVVAWRARRLGPPVEEPQQVQIEGSELTNAVGRLLATNRHPERAAAILRDNARRDLAPRLGLALDAPVDVVHDTITARTTLTDQDARRAIADPVTSDADLVVVARLLARIREELTHDRPVITTDR